MKFHLTEINAQQIEFALMKYFKSRLNIAELLTKRTNRLRRHHINLALMHFEFMGLHRTGSGCRFSNVNAWWRVSSIGRVQDTRGGTFLAREVGKDIGRYTLKGQFSWYTDLLLACSCDPHRQTHHVPLRSPRQRKWLFGEEFSFAAGHKEKLKVTAYVKQEAPFGF